MTDSISTRCERIGYPSDDLLRFVPLWMGGVAAASGNVAQPDHVMFELSSLVSGNVILAVARWLQEDLASVRRHAQETLTRSFEFYMGRWRDEIPSGSNGKSPPDRAWWDANWSWRRELEASLFCGFFIGAWDELKRIAEWLRDDVRLDIEQSKEDRAWLLIVAGVLKDRPWEEMGKWVTRIEQSHRKRERLLLAVLRAIVSSNQSDFDKALTAHFARYRRSELRSGLQSGNIMAFVDTMGTFLVHLAERNGLKANVPENMIDHIVRV